MTQKNNRVESVERALSILNAFKEGNAELSLAELATKTDLYKSTILRLIGSLELFGYIQKTAGGTYRLGPALFQLGVLYKQAFDIEAFVRPILAELVEHTGETAAYYIRQGERRQCLYRQNSPRSARHHLEEGILLPLDVGATGRILLAYEPGAEHDAEIKKQGFYVSLGERDPDVAAVAVPVLSQTGKIYGSLMVSGLRSRYNEAERQQALEALLVQAKKISAKFDSLGI
ncbi:IclR family transcriptional regulator [Paenalcaligenes sp. Me131]|uniref:IclR family transcriptional regulator n=1 Tax=Paenalcaligenes sp. Me131 TaxID=3392636 RepID=UPI003D2C6CDC